MTGAQWFDLLASAGALLACVLLARRPQGLAAWYRRALSGGLAALAALSLLHYLQAPPFGPLLNRPLHTHDFTHYYLGAKYFPEVGYERLYVCFVEASGNDFQATVLRDLRDKQVRPLASVLGDPSLACRPHFSAERWAQFVSDARTLRRLAPASDWQRFVQDYGFNPPPTWLLAGHPLASQFALTPSNARLLLLVDPALLLLGLFIALLAFGLLPTSLAIIAMTTFVPAAETWTIGSLLRWDWLFWLFVSIAAARRGRPLLSGAAFGMSAATRIFPLWALPPLILCAWLLHRRGESVRDLVRWGTGCTLAGTTLVLLSLGVADPAQWIAAIRNLLAHSGIYSVNSMGLRTSLSLPWSLWEAGRIYPAEILLAQLKASSFGAIWWLHAAIALPVLAYCGRLAQRPLWLLLAAALAWLPFGWTELSSYYYMYWGLLALTAAWRVSLAIPLLACNVTSVLLLAWLGKTPHLYAAISAAVCLAVAWQLALMARSGPMPAGTD